MKKLRLDKFIIYSFVSVTEHNKFTGSTGPWRRIIYIIGNMSIEEFKQFYIDIDYIILHCSSQHLWKVT